MKRILFSMMVPKGSLLLARPKFIPIPKTRTINFKTVSQFRFYSDEVKNPETSKATPTEIKKEESSEPTEPSKTIKESDEALGEEEDTESTGVIEKTDQETLLYFNNVIGFDLSRYRSLKFLHKFITPLRSTSEGLSSYILSIASPKDDPIRGISINSIFTKDGGAFVKFQIPYDSSIPEVNAKIQKNTAKAPRRIGGLLSKPSCFAVRGTPWVEDLSRYPSSILKVSFKGAELTEEKIYQIFRRYGTILDIIPQPVDSKEPTKYVLVKFRRFKSAIAAKNCVNALKVDNTVLHIRYEQLIRENILKEYITDHPRISIPILLALLLALGSIIFEPIREFFIREKIEQKYSISNYKNNEYFVSIMHYFSSIKNFFTRRTSNFDYSSDDHIWSERVEMINALKLWITENVNTFIVVRGPKGIGKEGVVLDHALKDRKNVLHIDCENIVKARNDSEFLKIAARQFGYFPIFPWLNSLSTFIDLGVKGLTGQVSGLSESTETQFKNMLSLAAIAIHHSSLRFYQAYVSQLSHDSNVTEDATKRLTEDDYLQQHPEEKPVVVINKFAAKSENYSFVYQSIASFAAFLVSMNIAHVIFLVDDVSPIPLLSDALPDQVFKTLVLSDASKSSSIEYVLSQLNEGDKLDEIKVKKEKHSPMYHYSTDRIEKALEPIGGRMLDLQAFVRRVKSGETPESAQKEMVKQAAEQIIQMNLDKVASDPANEFQVARAWQLIKLLAASEEIPFTKIYMTPLFKGKAAQSLSELEKVNLVSLAKQQGLVEGIKASRPLYRAAFQFMVNDPKCYNVLETNYLLKLIAYETKVIKTCEEEISALSYVAKSDAVSARFSYLGNKITTSTNNIMDHETKIKELVSKANKPKEESRFIFF